MIAITMVVGRIATPIEGKDVAGTHVVKFNVAWNDRRKKDGEWIDHANFIQCEIWAEKGVNFAKYMKQGDLVCLNGLLLMDDWVNKEGEKQYRLKLRVTECPFFPKNVNERGMKATTAPTAASKPLTAARPAASPAMAGKAANNATNLDAEDWPPVDSTEDIPF